MQNSNILEQSYVYTNIYIHIYIFEQFKPVMNIENVRAKSVANVGTAIL